MGFYTAKKLHRVTLCQLEKHKAAEDFIPISETFCALSLVYEEPEEIFVTSCFSVSNDKGCSLHTENIKGELCREQKSPQPCKDIRSIMVTECCQFQVQQIFQEVVTTICDTYCKCNPSNPYK